MRRADLIAHIRIAGYHGDTAAFIRLYTESRISYPNARTAFREGSRLKTSGIGCTCCDCKRQRETA